ncbi:transposase, partial [Glutamicibacter ardleyensis]
MSDRRSFSEEFKADAVEMVISSGSSLTDVSAVLGVNVQIAYNWLYSQNTKPRKP